MNTALNTGSREKMFSSFPAVLAVSLITVILIQWLPVLSLFFSLPLFVLYFIAEKKYFFAFSILLTCVLNTVVSISTLAFQHISLSFVTVVTACIGPSFFILPMLCLILPVQMRFRYRVALAGLFSAALWAVFFFCTEAGNELTSMIRSLTDETTTMLYSMVPEGFERSTFRSQLSPDSFYMKILNFLLYSILPMCMSMYAFSCLIALSVAKKLKKGSVPAFTLVSFYSDFILFIPLVCGMSGIIAGTLLPNRALTILSWNMALSSGLFFVVQGVGIVLFFYRLMKNKTGAKPFFVVFLILSLFVFNGWLFFLGCLLIAGVVELFVPLRTRFNNTDIIDPTPGRGSDQK